MSGPTTLPNAASTIAGPGWAARVATSVAIVLAASCKPFVNANASAIPTEMTSGAVTGRVWYVWPGPRRRPVQRECRRPPGVLEGHSRLRLAFLSIGTRSRGPNVPCGAEPQQRHRSTQTIHRVTPRRTSIRPLDRPPHELRRAHFPCQVRPEIADADSHQRTPSARPHQPRLTGWRIACASVGPTMRTRRCLPCLRAVCAPRLHL